MNDINDKNEKIFSKRVVQWYLSTKRRSLPWTQNRSIYNVWISEIMLQQTRVSTVIPYYNRFVKRFPNVQSIFDSNMDEILYYWSGLGYYARARNIYETARRVVKDFKGVFPLDFQTISSFPGIGRSTAGAILSISENLSFPVLDGNVKRVLIRFFGLKGIKSQIEKELWSIVDRLVPKVDSRIFNQGMMDLGSEICLPLKSPICQDCPLEKDCFSRNMKLIKPESSIFHDRKNRYLKEKEVQLLILIKKDRFFLKKVLKGRIWRELYIFPEFYSTDQLRLFLKKFDLLYPKDQIIEMKPILHSFSHIKLKIFPTKITIRKRNDQFSEHTKQHGIWYDMSGKQKIGIPKPIYSLMKEIINFSNSKKSF
ncbi:A/G-specific adenine glycosylase [Candidatus Riesia pediculicola]|uniref:A/G-specific adenine glycosylase n=1 Tax=Candidatus Riesia pediculicola TaxID=401619 RepID=UPI0009C3AC4A|nr:A/G-specific adenine glycosylase [Candidatus Riesia pediculicola]ARC54060.1 hypothetical protein AOE57_00215 [Candidatus Riesia pediculicola]